MKTRICLIGAVLILPAWLAHASPRELVEFEPDNWAPETDLSYALPGVALSTVASDHGDPRVFSRTPDEPYWASTGMLVFGHTGQYDEHWTLSSPPGFRHGALRVDFDPPVSFVSLDFIGNDASDAGQLSIYDTSGGLLAMLDTQPLAAGDVETLQFECCLEIGFIVAGGLGQDTVCLDRLQFAPIPEPTAAWTLLLVLATCRMRRRYFA